MKTIDVVSVFDPALDRKAMNVTEYAGTMASPAARDMGLVKCQSGKQPVIYKLRALTRKQHDIADSAGQVGARNIALMFGLAAVCKPGQQPMYPAHEMESDGDLIKVWDDAGLDSLQDELGRSVMAELALAILNLSGTLGNVYGGSGSKRFGLPPVLLLEAAQTDRLRAA